MKIRDDALALGHAMEQSGAKRDLQGVCLEMVRFMSLFTDTISRDALALSFAKVTAALEGSEFFDEILAEYHERRK